MIAERQVQHPDMSINAPHLILSAFQLGLLCPSPGAPHLYMLHIVPSSQSNFTFIMED